MAMFDFGKDVTIIPAVNEMTDKVVLWGLGKTPMLLLYTGVVADPAK
jgi:hypothetical protein